ncbi:MAG TPA: 4-hydroxybenzoate octaprenyltransferase [Rhodocyclaceae bacterium]|nr:4-hydroxybenzoate octaprenyltransferase [Rhodocyclaceae bacterium]
MNEVKNMTMTERLNAYEKLMRLDKPIGILLLLWPTLWGLWAGAAGYPTPLMIWIFVMGTVLMRSSGCVINDWADQRIDAKVARTKDRPLVTGLVRDDEALLLAAGLALCAFLMILPLHKLVWALSVVALLLAAIYPFTKRFFAIPQAWLGVAFGFGIPMAFAAQQFAIPPLAWIMLVANVFWAIAYDTEYAMVDRADDLKIGIRTSAITFGRFDVLAIMVCYACMLLIMVWVGRILLRGWIYDTSLAIAAAIAVYHYFLIRRREPEKCFQAFLQNNFIGAVIFAGLALDYALQKAPSNFGIIGG